MVYRIEVIAAAVAAAPLLVGLAVLLARRRTMAAYRQQPMGRSHALALACLGVSILVGAVVQFVPLSGGTQFALLQIAIVPLAFASYFVSRAIRNR